MQKNFSNFQKFLHQTRIRAIFWFIFILIVIGLGLVWIFYGKQAALFGLLCLLSMLIPTGLVVIALVALDLFTKKINSDKS